jgi:hypothetical protein
VDETKQRDTLGQDRHPCRSSLTISIRRPGNGTQEVSVRLRHHKRHVTYLNVSMPPQATELIATHLAVAKPIDLAQSIRDLPGCENVTSTQVYRAWKIMIEVLYRRDTAAIPSAIKLLDEYAAEGRVRRLEFTADDGVRAIAWALPELVDRVKEAVKEVSLDATCTSHYWLSF